MDYSIKKIIARQLLDCKARPMVEVDVITEKGCMGRGAAPTGTSVGSHEAFILRDNNLNEYNGMSVHRAVEMIEKNIAPALIGMDVRNQRRIDETLISMDGTADKSRLGGNSIYSISIAVLRAAAALEQLPVYRYLLKQSVVHIPLPAFNVVNGGMNGDIKQAFNEFMIAPYKASCIEEAAEIGIRIHKRLECVISRYQNGRSPMVGGSYGWAAPSSDPEVVLDLMARAVDECGYSGKVAFCLDCASSEMYSVKEHTYEMMDRRVSADEIIEKVRQLSECYPIIFVEDILAEDDWKGFSKAHQQIPRTNIIGDDLTVTSVERIKKAKEMDAIDGFVLKPNQIGTLTEAFDAVNYAKSKGMFFVPSGRSGGVIDDIVADLNIGLQALIVKNGVPKSGERMNKLNILLRASDELGNPPMADISQLIKFKH